MITTELDEDNVGQDIALSETTTKKERYTIRHYQDELWEYNREKYSVNLIVNMDEGGVIEGNSI
jgi:hypothetical protein